MFRSQPILRNIAFLFSAQGISYLVPLLTMPYLIRTLGPGGFGIYSLAIALSGYLQIPMEYGFALSATREIAKVRNDRHAIARIFWAVTWAKVVIGLIAGGVLSGVILAIPSLRIDAKLYIWAFAGAAISAFFPTWLLQGLEKMKDLAQLTVATKLANAAFIFLFLHHTGQLWRLMVWAVFVNFITMGIGHVWAFKDGWPRLYPPSIDQIIQQLVSGIGVFLSQVGFLLYANTNMIVLAAWYNPSVVGAYAIAEKIMRSAAMMTYAISQAIFPVSSRKFSVSIQDGELFLRKVLCASFFPILAGCLFLLIFAPYVIHIFSGASSGASISVLRLFSFLPLSIFLCNIYGSQILLTLGKDRQYLMGTLTAGCCALVLQFLLVPRFGAEGAAISLTVAEVGLLALYVGSCRLNGIRLFPDWGV